MALRCTADDRRAVSRGPERVTGIAMTVDYPVNGYVDARFAALKDALSENAIAAGNDPGDLGAALSIMVGGTTVVDLWAGYRTPDRAAAWERDTLVNAYSTMKPVAAVLALRLVADGIIDLDSPVAALWPEFATEGKESITLAQALAHQAGLPAIREVLPNQALYDWPSMAAAVARTPPWWTPGTVHGYHVNTYGFVIGEPVVRARHMSFTRAVRELAGRYSLDLHVGVADSDLQRVADIEAHSATRTIDPLVTWPGDDPATVLQRHVNANPPGIAGIGVVNTTQWRRAAVPSTNGHATARGLSRFYNSLLLPSKPQPSNETVLPPGLITEATRVHSSGLDFVLGKPSRFGLGFMLHQDERPIGLTPDSFGHYGYGGSLGFADADSEVSFAYLINRPGDRWQNPRVRRLLATLHDCLA